MAKRINITFKHYEIIKKQNDRWFVDGTAKTLEACREAEAVKCRPRFNRN